MGLFGKKRPKKKRKQIPKVESTNDEPTADDYYLPGLFADLESEAKHRRILSGETLFEISNSCKEQETKDELFQAIVNGLGEWMKWRYRIPSKIITLLKCMKFRILIDRDLKELIPLLIDCYEGSEGEIYVQSAKGLSMIGSRFPQFLIDEKLHHRLISRIPLPDKQRPFLKDDLSILINIAERGYNKELMDAGILGTIREMLNSKQLLRFESSCKLMGALTTFGGMEYLVQEELDRLLIERTIATGNYHNVPLVQCLATMADHGGTERLVEAGIHDILTKTIQSSDWSIRCHSVYIVGSIVWDVGADRGVLLVIFLIILEALDDEEPLVCLQAKCTLLIIGSQGGIGMLAQSDVLDVVTDNISNEEIELEELSCLAFTKMIRSGLATEDMITTSVPILIEKLEKFKWFLHNELYRSLEPYTDGKGFEMSGPPETVPIDINPYPWLPLGHALEPLNAIAEAGNARILVENDILPLLKYYLNVPDEYVFTESKRLLEAIGRGGCPGEIAELCLDIQADIAIKLDDEQDIPLHEQESYKYAQLACGTKVMSTPMGRPVNIEDVMIMQPRIEKLLEERDNKLEAWAKDMIEKFG